MDINCSKALVIFTARESILTLIQTLLAAIIATDDMTTIHVLVNRNQRLKNDLLEWYGVNADIKKCTRLKIWFIKAKGKAHAWNQYHYFLWKAEDLVFFIDGYTRLQPNAIRILGDTIQRSPAALGGSGLPDTVVKHSKRVQALIRKGAFQGNLCCLKGSAIRKLKDHKFFFPLGLYRVDGLMGAVLHWRLDFTQLKWDNANIVTCPNAIWNKSVKRWWHPKDLLEKVQQILRQNQGMLENIAITDHFVNRKMVPSQLPGTASELILDWIMRHPKDFYSILWRYPLVWFVRRSIKKPFDWADASVPPEPLT